MKIITACAGVKYDFSRAGLVSSKSALAKELGISIENLKTLTQVHGDSVCIVRDKNEITDIIEADCLITNIPNVCLGIKTADCLPLAIYDLANNVISMIHLGRKSLNKGLLQKTVNVLKSEFNSSPKNLQVWIYPNLQRKNHITHLSEAANFPPNCITELPKGVHISNNSTLFWEFLEKNNLELEDLQKIPMAMVDMEKFVVEVLAEMGVDTENINSEKIDTFTDKNYASYRRDYPKHTLMLSYIMMKKL